jgi:hypothetical protein
VSLYREPGRRRALVGWIVAVAALAAGLGGGYALGRSSAPEPTAAAVVERLRADLRPVAGGLELLPTEYPQTRGGAGGEEAAVRGDLDRIRSGLRAAGPDLRMLAPDAARELERAVAALEAAIGARASPAEVERLATAATAALARVPGGG